MTTPDETVQTEVDEIRVRLLPDGRMTRADAARYLGLQPKTLSMWRLQGKGPRVTRVGACSTSSPTWIPSSAAKQRRHP